MEGTGLVAEDPSVSCCGVPFLAGALLLVVHLLAFLVEPLVARISGAKPIFRQSSPHQIPKEHGNERQGGEPKNDPACPRDSAHVARKSFALPFG